MTIWAVWFSFRGRINRKTFWLKGILLPAGIHMALVLLADVITMWSTVAALLWVQSVTLTLIVILVSVSVKRLHDRNRSGWWILTILIPIVGFILAVLGLVALGFLKGDSGPNRYGDVQ